MVIPIPTRWRGGTRMAVTQSRPAHHAGEPPAAACRTAPGSGASTPSRARPGRSMSLGILLQMSGICYDPAGWTHVDVFYVKERFLFFTHWVAVHFQPSLIMHSVSPPGGPGAEPARDLVCPAGISKSVTR